jgi:hypothetical protein
LFALAVVPLGTRVESFGRLAADKGKVGQFYLEVIVPEPAMLGSLALAVGLILRRVRAPRALALGR